MNLWKLLRLLIPKARLLVSNFLAFLAPTNTTITIFTVAVFAILRVHLRRGGCMCQRLRFTNLIFRLVVCYQHHVWHLLKLTVRHDRLQKTFYIFSLRGYFALLRITMLFKRVGWKSWRWREFHGHWLSECAGRVGEVDNHAWLSINFLWNGMNVMLTFPKLLNLVEVAGFLLTQNQRNLILFV